MLPTVTPNMQSFLAGADLSASQYCFVKGGVNAGEVVLCGAGERPLGILMNAPIATETADVATPGGGGLLKMGGVVAKNALVKSDASGNGVTAAIVGTYVGAVVLPTGANCASGDVVPVFVVGPIAFGASAAAADTVALAQTISGSYVAAEVQAISTKVDLLRTNLRAAGLML